MALVFVDSFDHYDTAHLAQKWIPILGTGGSYSIAAGAGRRGTAAARWTSVNATGGNESRLTQVLPPQSTWICGMAIRVSELPDTAKDIWQWRDGVVSQCEVWLNATGTLSVTRNGTHLGTTIAAVFPGTYYYLEWKLVIDNAAGATELRVDGVPWLTLSGVDTQGAAVATATVFRMGSPDAWFVTKTMDVDDLYICDGTGSAPHNTFLGDCRVDALMPSGEGANSAWTPSTGTVHWSLVEEIPPNEDTDYLSAVTPGVRDTHAMGNLPTMPTPTIWGAQHCLHARKEDAGLCQIKSVVKSAATTQAGAEMHALALTYTYYRTVWPVDPATGLAWTTAAIDAVETGAEKV